MAFNVAFDIAKFSEAITSPDHNKIEWTHTTGKHMQCLLEGSDGPYDNATLRMDVFQGTTLLESVDIAEYIDASIRLRDAKFRAGAGFKIEDLAIFGITKEPILALRYQLDGKARRLQMRLNSSENFQQIVSILSRRGMEFSQQRPNTGRTDTSSARPNTAQLNDRPLATHNPQVSKKVQASSVSRPSPFHIPSMEAGSLSQRRDVDTSSPTRKAGQLTAPERELPSRKLPVQQWQPHPSQSTRSDAYNVQLRPEAHTSVAVVRDEVDREATRSTAEDFFQFSAAGPEDNDGGFKLPPQQSLSSGELQSHASALSSDSFDQRPSTALSRTSATSLFPNTLEHEIPPERVLPFKATGNLRPSSGLSMPFAAPLSASDTLEHEIPPPRELPFKLSISSRDYGGCGTSRPGSALPPPPSKKAKISPERPKTAGSVQKRQSEMSAQVSRSNDAVEPLKSNYLPLQNSISFAATKSAPFERQEHPAATVPMSDLVYGRSGSPHTKKRMSSTMDAPHEIESPPGSAEKRDFAPTQRAARSDASAMAKGHGVDDNTGNFIPSADESDGSTLFEFTSQTPEARLNALEQFMIGKLQDPSFTTLCEDVEHCWRRFALGL